MSQPPWSGHVRVREPRPDVFQRAGFPHGIHGSLERCCSEHISLGIHGSLTILRPSEGFSSPLECPVACRKLHSATLKPPRIPSQRCVQQGLFAYSGTRMIKRIFLDSDVAGRNSLLIIEMPLSQAGPPLRPVAEQSPSESTPSIGYGRHVAWIPVTALEIRR